jgi:hypothetical protein
MSYVKAGRPSSKKKRRNIVLMLLGSGEFLEHRQNIKNKLELMGYKKVIIMEDIIKRVKKASGTGLLQRNFEWILDRHKPDFFMVFFYNNARLGAITFEIGYICGKYRTRLITKKLRFLFEKGYDYDQITTEYITNLFSDTLQVEFDDSSEHYNAVELVRNFVAI